MSQSQSPDIYVHVYPSGGRGGGFRGGFRGGYQGGRGGGVGRGGRGDQGGRGGGIGRGGRGCVGGKIRKARPRCNNCNLVGHVASVCWTKPSETAATRAARLMYIALELKSRAEVVSKAAASVVAAAAAAETAATEAMSRALKLKAAIAAETPLPTTMTTPEDAENDKYKSNNITDSVNNSC